MVLIEAPFLLGIEYYPYNTDKMHSFSRFFKQK